MGALAVGFSAATFAVGSLMIGRLASPAGLLVSVCAGIAYAVAVRAAVDHGLPARRLPRRAVGASVLRAAQPKPDQPKLEQPRREQPRA